MKPKSQSTIAEAPGRPRQLTRQRRISELVADDLRKRILSGDLADGELLPKQEELLEEYGISPPSIREALGILETEGLMTVQRGRIGGGVVHRPQPSKVAYMIGLVLQSRAVDLGDLVDAMRWLEPACAAAAARRPDRHTTVLPRLRANMDEGMAAIEDSDTWIRLARQYHMELVAHCGNETMSLVVGALEALWSAQVDLHAREGANHGSFSDSTTRRSMAAEHETLYRLISEGDAEGAERCVHEHYSGVSKTPAGQKHGFDHTATVDATRLRH